MTSKELVDKIVENAQIKKARDIKILDLRHLTSITDYFIICSGDAPPQVRAICDQIEDGLELEQVKVWHKEGYSNLQWVLLDYVDVVVHIFLPELREFYSLERLWGDAVLTEIAGE